MTGPVVTRILLLRHAQSTWNAEGRWQGWADPPLSDAGERDAAAARLPGADSATAIVASDLRRARRTAEVMAPNHGWAAVRLCAGLRERGVGAWTGLTRDEIERRWPGQLHAVPAAIVGGESPAAVIARALASLQRIADRWPGRSVVAVTHGGVNRAVERHAGAEPAPLANLEGRWVEVSAAGVTLGPRARPATAPGDRPAADVEPAR